MCREILENKFTRVAWMIPIQGSIVHLFPRSAFPPNFSYARLVTPGLDHIDFPRPSSLTTSQLDRNITWTPTSLSAVWDFLIQVRRHNNFGPITLSYTVKSNACVYFKVACDAPVATRLRASLAAWKAPDGEDLRGVVDKYYLRLLRPCRLLLVEDTGTPLLIA